MQLSSPDRRDLIKHLALISGLVISSASLESLAAALLKPTDMSRAKGKLLNADQLALLRDLGDVTIPATDTPGALATGAHDFINYFAPACLSSDQQTQLLTGLDMIATQSQSLFTKPFTQLTIAEKISLLTRMEKAESPFTQTDREQIKLIKSLVTFAYYTSQAGATQELAYLAIPGGYKGNFKFSTVGKAWALSQ